MIETILFLTLVGGILRWMTKEAGKDHDRESTRYRSRRSTTFPDYTPAPTATYDLDEMLQRLRDHEMEIRRVEIPRFDFTYNSSSSSQRRRRPTFMRYDKLTGDWDEY